MKRYLALPCALGLLGSLPAPVQADRSDCSSGLERSYSIHYKRVVKAHGARQPGRHIRRQGMRAGHGAWRPARCGELRRSLRTFKRWLAPPPAPVGRSDRAPGWGSTAPVATGGGYAIPSAIVQCESGGDYGAYNGSSGARGAYQVIGSTHAAICPDLGWSPPSKTNAPPESGSSRAAEPGPARRCGKCGGPLVQRANEKPGRFAARQFCSRRCAAAVGSEQATANRLAEPTPTHVIERNGYRMRYVREPPPPSALARGRKLGRYVYEHRLVMEQHLGRKLRSTEIVHHVNHDRHDNRLENLQVYDSHSKHKTGEALDSRGPFPSCPVCGEPARRDRTFCSRACWLASR